jgi:hypothetical protein
VAERVRRHLAGSGDVTAEISRWMKIGRFDELKLTGSGPGFRDLLRVGEIRLRSHFATAGDAPVEIEEDLRHLGGEFASAMIYKGWNSDVLIEPEELFVDLFAVKGYSTRMLGKLIVWLMAKVDKVRPETEGASMVDVLAKNDLEQSYIGLVSRILECSSGIANCGLQVSAWPLREFGLFPENEIPKSKGAVWAAGARLNDAVSRPLFNSRPRNVPKILRTQYAELKGLGRLRLALRKEWKTENEPRHRFLVFTSSVRLLSGSTVAKEFDGAIVKISARSGQVTFYGMETKTNNDNALTALERSVKDLGLKGKTYSVAGSRHHAVMETRL